MIEKGSIVQIIDEKHSWCPCLLFVDEVKSWGVQACVFVPQSNDGSQPPAQVWTRLTFEQIRKVGDVLFWFEIVK